MSSPAYSTLGQIQGIGWPQDPEERLGYAILVLVRIFMTVNHHRNWGRQNHVLFTRTSGPGLIGRSGVIYQYTPYPTPLVEKPLPVIIRRAPIIRRMAKERLPPFRITKRRDPQIIETVAEFGAATTVHIEALFFKTVKTNLSTKIGQGDARPGKINSRCQYRLQMLFHHGYLSRDEQPQKLSEGRKPLVYFLARKGADLLAAIPGENGKARSWNPRDFNVKYPFLEHLLATNTIRVIILLGARKLRWKVAEWRDERILKRAHIKDSVTITGPQGGQQRATVIPDGYFCLTTNTDTYHFFLETDLRTVTGEASRWGERDWARKVRAYLAYHQTGLYQKRYGTADMRILIITVGERRLENLKAVTERAGGRGRFWFTTFERITPENIFIEPIWQVASREGFFSLLG